MSKWGSDIHTPLAWVLSHGAEASDGTMDHAGESISHWSAVHLARVPLPRCERDRREIKQRQVELLCGRRVPSDDDTWGPPNFGPRVMDKSFHVRASRRRAAGERRLNRCSRCFKRAEAELEIVIECRVCAGRLPCSTSGPCGGSRRSKPRVRGDKL